MNDIARATDGPAFSALRPAAERLEPSRWAPVQTAKDISDLQGTVKSVSIAGALPGNSITNANGAPQLDGPAIGFSAQDMASTLLALQAKTAQGQASVAQKGIARQQPDADEKLDRAMAKINDWIQKCESATAQGKAAGILKWIQDIAGKTAAGFAEIAHVMTTASTATAAAKLLAVAMVAIASSTVTVASGNNQAATGAGPDRIAEWANPGASNGTGTGKGKVADAAEPSAQPAEMASATVALAATIAIMAASTLLTGGGSVASATQNIILTAAHAGQTAGTAAIPGAEISASNGKATAKPASPAASQADKDQIGAVIAALQQHVQQGSEALSKVLHQVLEATISVHRLIDAAGESRTQLASQLSASGKARPI